jgi:hypothetical protein
MLTKSAALKVRELEELQNVLNEQKDGNKSRVMITSSLNSLTSSVEKLEKELADLLVKELNVRSWQCDADTVSEFTQLEKETRECEVEIERLEERLKESGSSTSAVHVDQLIRMRNEMLFLRTDIDQLKHSKVKNLNSYSQKIQLANYLTLLEANKTAYDDALFNITSGQTTGLLKQVEEAKVIVTAVKEEARSMRQPITTNRVSNKVKEVTKVDKTAQISKLKEVEIETQKIIVKLTQKLRDERTQSFERLVEAQRSIRKLSVSIFRISHQHANEDGAQHEELKVLQSHVQDLKSIKDSFVKRSTVGAMTHLTDYATRYERNIEGLQSKLNELKNESSYTVKQDSNTDVAREMRMLKHQVDILKETCLREDTSSDRTDFLDRYLISQSHAIELQREVDLMKAGCMSTGKETDEVGELRRRNSDLENQCKVLRKRIETLGSKQNEICANMANMYETDHQIETVLEESMNKSMNSEMLLHQENNKLRKELDAVKKKLVTMSKLLEEKSLPSKIPTKQPIGENLEKRLESSSKELIELKKQIKKLEEENKDLRSSSEIESFSEEIKNLRTLRDELEQQVSELQADPIKDSESETEVESARSKDSAVLIRRLQVENQTL